MHSWQRRFLDLCVSAALLATLAHVFDRTLRADSDVPIGIRVLASITGVAGVAFAVAGWASRSHRDVEHLSSRRAAAKVVLLLLAIWCGYCAAFAAFWPRVNH